MLLYTLLCGGAIVILGSAGIFIGFNNELIYNRVKTHMRRIWIFTDGLTEWTKHLEEKVSLSLSIIWNTVSIIKILAPNLREKWK